MRTRYSLADVCFVPGVEAVTVAAGARGFTKSEATWSNNFRAPTADCARKLFFHHTVVSSSSPFCATRMEGESGIDSRLQGQCALNVLYTKMRVFNAKFHIFNLNFKR